MLPKNSPIIAANSQYIIDYYFNLRIHTNVYYLLSLIIFFLNKNISNTIVIIVYITTIKVLVNILL